MAAFATSPSSPLAVTGRGTDHTQQADHPAACESDYCRPVYEEDASHPLGRRIVVTPWMLMDSLAECCEDAEIILQAVEESGIGLERRHGLLVNPLAERMEKLHFGVSHLLKLLWRSGLWTDQPVDEAISANGRTYLALRAPFTDGKPGGRPVPADLPAWQRELLGLPVTGSTRCLPEPSSLSLAGLEPCNSEDGALPEVLPVAKR